MQESGAARIVRMDVITHGIAADARSNRLIALLDAHEQPLFAFLTVMLGDRDSAKDCAQDTFLRAYENLRKGKPVNVQWLYKVARNRAIDELRHRQRERSHPSPIGDATVEADDFSEEWVAVQRALLQLSPDDREVLYLAEVDGFTSIEIGAMLGVRPGTVRMRLLRAHQRFRALYGVCP